MEKDEERKCSDGCSTVRHGELIDHSAFRRPAQEARTSGPHDAGPVAGPGQPAAHHSRHDLPD
ncbi:hypothetical protein CFB46_07920 [Burkholderia sp. HI2761]|nr:hypothetical protein [Burkholderia sp. BE24]OXJ28108.1 hypothetical protein CFB46_07920 [Burkholderia sp. HI2761]